MSDSDDDANKRAPGDADRRGPGLPLGVTLFRPAVLAKRLDSTLGVTLLPPSGWMSAIAVVSLLIVGAGLVTVTFGEVTRRVPTVGWLVFEPGDAAVHSPRAGVVTQLFRKEGDRVDKGEPLAEITTGRSSMAAVDVERTIAATLRSALETTQRQLAFARQLSQTRRKTVEQSLTATRANIETLMAARIVSERRAALAAAEAERSAKLATQGLIALTASEKAQDASLAADLAVQELSQRLTQEEHKLQELQEEMNSIPLLLDQRLAELESDRLEIQQRIADVQGMQDALVTAPFAGTVTSVTARRGQTVAANEKLLILVPEGAKLKGQVLIPSRAAGFVNPGLSVRVRYDAFPYQRYGSHAATVSSLETALVQPADRRTPVQLDEPAYLATIELANASVEAFNRKLELKSGMTFRADVYQDTHRIIDLLLDPLVGLRDEL